MKKAILATKVGMTQIFNEDGVLTPVTVLQAGPCVVTQVKTVENDGYAAVQVGFVDAKEKFMKSTASWLDFLKLRLSWGQVGNANIPSGLLVQEYVANSSSWINGYNSSRKSSKYLSVCQYPS